LAVEGLNVVFKTSNHEWIGMIQHKKSENKTNTHTRAHLLSQRRATLGLASGLDLWEDGGQKLVGTDAVDKQTRWGVFVCNQIRGREVKKTTRVVRNHELFLMTTTGHANARVCQETGNHL
jgi:hypothetical protein